MKPKLVRNAVSEEDSNISLVNSERSVSRKDHCSFKTVNKSKFKKHKKKTDIPASPERKKPKLASDVSKASVKEIL